MVVSKTHVALEGRFAPDATYDCDVSIKGPSSNATHCIAY